MLTFAQFKEKVLAECTQLDEAHKIGNKVTIHKGTGAGITGHIGEIRKKFKGDTDPTYTVFHGDNQAITVSKNQIKAVKEQLDEGFSKPRGYVNITKDEHDVILKKRLEHEKEHGTKNHRDVQSKEELPLKTRSTMVSNGGDQSIHGLPEIVHTYDTKTGKNKYYRQPVGGHVKESLDEGLSKEELSAIKQHYSTQKHIMADIGDYEYYTKHNDNKSAESIAKKLKAMAIDDKVINEKFAHLNHKKLDANGSGELDAEDFKLLRAKKKTAAGKLTKEENEVLESLLAKLDEKCAMKSVKEDDAEEDEEEDDEECEESCDSKAKK
jgi:hypothetical protein